MMEEAERRRQTVWGHFGEGRHSGEGQTESEETPWNSKGGF